MECRSVSRMFFCVVLTAILLLAFTLATAESSNEALASELYRMARGDLTEEEAALNEDAFAAIPEKYSSLSYNTQSYLVMIAERGISDGQLTEDQAKLLCISFGQVQQEAKKNWLVFRHEYKGEKVSEIAISFSTRTAVYVGPPVCRHGIVTGNRDEEFRVEWDNGTGTWYECWGSEGKRSLYSSYTYESYDELAKGEETDVLFWSAESLTAGKDLVRGTDPDSVWRGDLIYFGNYPQGLDEEAKSPIEWVVVDYDGTKVTLMSRKNLAMKRFHNKDKKVTWANCDLRKWLNGEFMKQAFSRDEQKCLLQIKHEGASDKVTLISQSEANRIFPGYSSFLSWSDPWNEFPGLLYAEYTLYAMMMDEDRKEGIEMAGSRESYQRRGDWWTCTVDSEEKDWVICEDKYKTGMEWTKIKNDRLAGVRPVIRIDLKKAEYYILPKSDEE